MTTKTTRKNEKVDVDATSYVSADFLSKLNAEFLSQYSLVELQNVDNILHGVLESKKKEQLEAAKEEIRKIANNLGMDVETVMGLKKRNANSGIGGKVLYRHPDDANLTWVGRGRKPGWLVEAVKAGHSLDEFKVPSEEESKTE